MINLTKKQFIAFWIFLLVALPLLSYFLHVIIPFYGDTETISGGTKWGFPHGFFMLLSGIAWVVVIIGGIAAFTEDDGTPGKFLGIISFPPDGAVPSEVDTPVPISFSIRRPLSIVLLVIVAICAYRFLSSSALQMASVYNASKVYHNQYDQRTMERKGFYDKLWKTFLQKEKVTNLNKETFVEVSRIIMENRKDGQNVTWKWVKENQNIPFDEFTRFYTDLSGYIESQREEYYGLEKGCQSLATANNMLLDTFPNNVYNRVLKCQKITYEYGFLSDSTDKVFTSKKENFN